MPICDDVCRFTGDKSGPVMMMMMMMLREMFHFAGDQNTPVMMLFKCFVFVQETETLQLQPPQLQFLLEDLVCKLEHILLASNGKKRFFLKVEVNAKVPINIVKTDLCCDVKRNSFNPPKNIYFRRLSSVWLKCIS